MAVCESPGGGAFPSVLADAVKAAVETTFTAICGEKPVHQPGIERNGHGSCVAGIISFLGDVPWSLACVLPQETAPALGQKFTGMEIPFDTPDMGDVAGELVNVLAGEVVAQLEQRRVKAQMSLPTVARGNSLELIPEKGLTVSRLDFTSKQGSFWFRLASAKPGQPLGRVPGT